MQVDGCERVWAIADEDLDREDEQKTSSVHFLRFEFTDEMADALKGGAKLVVGIDHPAYDVSVVLPHTVQTTLTKDLA